MNCIIISIGDELLIGQTINTNSAWMGKELNAVGVDVTEVLTISDKEKAIKDALVYAESKASIVLLTGGLGPTKDDITKKVFSDYFDAPLIQNQEALNNVIGFFERFSREMLPVNELQALIPTGSTMLLNKKGTAPGMWMEKNETVFASMPGVPYEMKYLMSFEVLPRLERRFDLPFIVHQTMMTQGIGESYVAEEISDIEDNLPSDIGLAYLPSPGLLKLRLTGKGTDKDDLKHRINSIFDQIELRIPDYVYSREEKDLAEIIGEVLLQKGLTVSTAESCTSGAIASKLTSFSGASEYFIGGLVAYSNEIKKNQLKVSEQVLNLDGAVSEACVKQMAIGAKSLFNTDYAIATSGIAGPNGGTDLKPVGTVWIAIAAPNGIIAERFQMGEGRGKVVKKTLMTALSLFLTLVK